MPETPSDCVFVGCLPSSATIIALRLPTASSQILLGCESLGSSPSAMSVIALVSHRLIVSFTSSNDLFNAWTTVGCDVIAAGIV